MPKRIQIGVAAVAALVLATPAGAAPILMSAQLTIRLQGLASMTFAGTGTVDVTGSLYQIPAGLIALTAPITVPVTTNSAVASLQAVGVSNLAASLSLGGATAQAPSEVCVPTTGQACVAGGGIGGVMPLSGLVNVQIVPGMVTVPIDLFVLRFGQGGAVNAPFTADAAVWTTGTAISNNGGFTTPTKTTVGGPTPSGGITLVTATFIAACGNILPSLSSLTLTPIVPEPSVWLLLGAGAFGLLISIRSR